MAGVVFDSTYLIDLFNTRLAGLQRVKLDHLIEGLSKRGQRVLIPTPVLTEILVKAGKARDEYLNKLNNATSFEVIAFDRRAATECALQLEANWDSKNRKAVTRTKFKFDWMIVSCAASRGATAIYSDDDDIRRCAELAGIQVISQNQLLIPAEALQLPIDLGT